MSTAPTPPPAAGWATPEHFQAIVKQILSLLAILGVLQTSDAGNLQSQLAACITAGFIFAINAWQVVTFVKGQVTLKLHGKTASSGLPLFLLAALVVGVFTAPAAAQCPCPCGPPCVCPSCPGGTCYISQGGIYPAALLPWRSQLEKQLQQQQQALRDLQGQLQAQQQCPAPGGPIAYGPQQTLPILGAPQVLPLQGAPLQSVPIAGQPHMLLPIEGNPHLLVPILGSPKQQLPVAPQQPPQPALPVSPVQPSQPSAPAPQPRTMPPATGVPQQPQAYTVRTYALYRPKERDAMSLEKLLIFNAAAALTQAACGNAGASLAVDPDLKDDTVRAKNLQVWETCRVFYAAINGALADNTSWPEPQLNAGSLLPSLVQGVVPLLTGNPQLSGLINGLLTLIPKPAAPPRGPVPNPGAPAKP